MYELSSTQWSILNTRGGDAIRQAVKDGELPDCPIVNARIAERCKWANPAMWSHGPWFKAEYINSKFRNGQVSVRRYVTPDEKVNFTVVPRGGRWCDRLSVEEAQKCLRSIRDRDGRVVLLNAEEVARAENDHNWALSR